MKLLQNAGIYIIRHRDSGKCYVGKDTDLGNRAKQHLTLKSQGCKAIHNAIKKYGSDAFDVELIPYPNISPKALSEVEKWKIRQLKSHKSQGGYNLTWGGDGFDSETGQETSRKSVIDGTHPFLGGEIQRKHARKTNLKRVANGTHPFLGSENNGRRLADGTHHFLDESIRRRSHYAYRINRKSQRRDLYRIYAALLYSKSVFEEHLYNKRKSDGFFDQEIPDTSKAAQLDLF